VGNERVSIAADLFDELKAGSAAPLAQPHRDEAASEHVARRIATVLPGFA
jgi:hypothetical protein